MSNKIAIPDGDKLSPELQKKLIEDLEKNPIRKLTQAESELYTGAVINAVRIMPAFRDAVSLLKPYMDATAPTAYVDPHARVAVSYWFLHILDPFERGAVLLHESMHVMNDHFSRAENGGINPKYRNTAGDLEINTVLRRAAGVTLPTGVLYPDADPFNFPAGQTLEQYAKLLKDSGYEPPESNNNSQPGEGDPDDSEDGSEDGSGQGSGEPGEGEGSGKKVESSGSSWGCGDATENRSAAADDAGIERSSKSEQNVVVKNTIARIQGEADRARAAGNSHQDELYKLILDRIYKPKVDWRQMLKRATAKANDSITRGRADYSYRRVSRRMSGSQYIFPGMIQYVPTMMLALDISGSMSTEDYALFLTEVEALLKGSSRSKGGLKIFPVDTQVGNIKMVKSVNELELRGGGGTDMNVAFMYLQTLSAKEKPDVFILATDGGTNWTTIEETARQIYRKTKLIVLVTSEYGWKTVPESLKGLITMIDVSEKK